MFKIALRNILRNKRRTVLTGLSISVAVMIVIYLWSFITGIVDGLIENTVRLNSGHIRILNTDYVRREKMLPLESYIANYAEVQKIAEENPEVTLATGRMKFGVLLEHKGENKPVIGTGIDPAKEDKISRLSSKIVEGRKVQTGVEEVNIGTKLAKELGLKLGDTLTIVTQTAYGSIAAMNLKIVGVFSFGIPSIDGRIFYMPLDKAQELLDLKGSVTEIFLLIKNLDAARKVAAKIESRLDQEFPGQFATKAWQEQGIIWFYMTIARYIYAAIYFIILFLASFTILNTMFMAVLERTREIGMMKALGLKNWQVVRIIMIEALLIGIIAGFIGAIWGAGVAYYLSVKGIDLTATFEAMGEIKMELSYIYRAVFSWGIVFTGFFFGVFFAVLAALPPALRAAKMEPTEALREI
jgi:putative ABC transport system permease protein